jgi:hypothetical protein
MCRISGNYADMTTERAETDAEQALRNYERKLQTMAPAEIDLLAVEREVRALIEARGRELMTTALQQADTSAPEVEIDGQRWGNRRVHRGEYQTAFGVVELSRSVYQQAGRGRVAVPLDLRLGIVEGRYTPMMARILTRAIAVMPEHEAAAFLAEVGTARVSSATLSRLPRMIAARYETRREVIEARLRERDVIPDDATTVQVGLDGVMVPQDGEYARRRGRRTDSPDPPRHERRYGTVGQDSPAANDGHAGRAWHEASVGTVAYFDHEGRRLKTVYHARMPEPCKTTLIKTLEVELAEVISERPTLNIVFASDGAPQHWAALEAMEKRLPEPALGRRMKLVDAFHVAEYIQNAANAIEGEGTSGAAILAATWREVVKEKPSGGETVVRSMRARRATIASAARRDELDEAIAYIAGQNELGRMQYAEARSHNYPIGTGITEAAAKTIVGTRMKRAGARFSQHGGQTILLFRAALLSERFEALHAELASSYTREVKIAA